MTTPSPSTDIRTERPPRNAIGAVAFAVGVVAVVLGGVLSVAQAPLAGSSIATFGLINTIREALIGLLGVVALVVGIVGLLVRSPRKAFAAAGAAIGGVLLANLLFGLLFSAVLSLR